MKRILIILLTILPLFATAKEDKKKDNYNPKYLTGAITTIDGKIVFSESVKIPSMSKKELFDNILKWANQRFKPENNMNSRVVFTDEDKGEIAAVGEEYIVFSSNFISLDRTRIYYHLFVEIKDGEYTVNMERIRYWYDENRNGGERYTAEDWINDEMALNKKKTKLAPICGKFRKGTIDLKDNLFESLKNYLGQNTHTYIAQPGNIPGKELKAITISQLPSNLNEIVSKGKVTITSGEEEIEATAESWGGFGKLLNKDVTYTLVDKSRMALSTVMEHCKTYKISFYINGESKPYITIECNKTMTQRLSPDDLKSLNQNIDRNKEYTMYIGEVVSVMMR